MSSGSAADVNNAGTLGRGTPSVNVNGNTTAGGYTIDGAYAPSTVPNPDTISEFKIQTSQYDAMFGAMVPSTNLMTKRGENNFHGDALGIPAQRRLQRQRLLPQRYRPAQAQPETEPVRRHAGGPIRKNKLFFFSSYQGTRQVNGLDPTSVSNPILPALSDDRSAAALAAQFCPANHTCRRRRATSHLRRRQAARLHQSDHGHHGAHQSRRASACSRLKDRDGRYLIPSPQTIFTSGANAGLGFSSYSLPSTYKENHFLANTDYLAFAQATRFPHASSAPPSISCARSDRPGGYPGAPIVPGWGAAQALAATDIAPASQLTSQFSANMVNEAAMTFTRNRTDTDGVDTPPASALRHDRGRSVLPAAARDHRARTARLLPPVRHRSQ